MMGIVWKEVAIIISGLISVFTWSISGGLPSCDSAPASLLAYTTTNKVLKTVALSLVWKELSW
jgi:hypothetical protein